MNAGPSVSRVLGPLSRQGRGLGQRHLDKEVSRPVDLLDKRTWRTCLGRRYWCRQFLSDECSYPQIPIQTPLHSVFFLTLSLCATSRARARNWLKGCAFAVTFSNSTGSGVQLWDCQQILHPR